MRARAWLPPLLTRPLLLLTLPLLVTRMDPPFTEPAPGLGVLDGLGRAAEDGRLPGPSAAGDGRHHCLTLRSGGVRIIAGGARGCGRSARPLDSPPGRVLTSGAPRAAGTVRPSASGPGGGRDEG